MQEAADKPKILIVDDEPENIHLLIRILRDSHTVIVATDGEKALDAANTAPIPDLILLDVLMPGMNGYQVCTLLKAAPRTRDIPVIFVTGAAEEHDERQGLELGAVDFIMKPYKPELLVARIKNQLELKRYRDSLERLVEQRTAELYAANASLKRELAERLQAEEALRDNEQKYHLLFDTAIDGIYIVSREDGEKRGRILDANPAAAELFGRSIEEMRTLNIIDVSAEPEKSMASVETVPKHIPHRLYRRKDGTVFPVEISLSSFVHEGRQLLIGFIRDITRREQTEQELRASLAEKEALLRELYHRTKNNMQVICSLMNLKAASLEDEELHDVLMEMENRIRSMSLVHEKLYQSKNLSDIDLGEYTGDLATLLQQSYSDSISRIRLTLELEEIHVFIDTAIPFGLLVNELISNAYKHGFPAGRSGEIRLFLHKEADNTIVFTAADTGVGMPGTANPKALSSMGMQTIYALGEGQLDGTVAFSATDPSGGLTCTVRFRNLGSKSVRHPAATT